MIVQTRALCLLFFVAVIAACESTPTTSSGLFGKDTPPRPHVDRKDTGIRHGSAIGVDTFRVGTGEFVNHRPSKRQGESSKVAIVGNGELVELSLVNASIAAAAEEVLGKALGLTYVISSEVSGRVTVQTTRPVPKNVLFSLFEAALDANGASISNRDGIVRIVPGNSGNRAFSLASLGAVNDTSIIVAPLEFVSPVAMLDILEPLTKDGLQVRADNARNLLLLSGPQAVLEAALDALNLFDVDVMKGKSVALVRLKAASPEDVVEELNTIFETREGGSLTGVVQFVPNPRLNSVLIISTKAVYMDRARGWIRDLDRQAAGSARFLKTYDLHHRNADEVAEILNSLLTEKGGSPGSVAGGAAGTDTSYGEDIAKGVNAPKVAADTSRNSLVVRATQDEHAEISAMLRDLDTAARQVLLEATIAEVTLNDELNVGVRWYFESGNIATRFTDLASGAVAGTNPGFSAVLSKGNASVALSALAAVTEVKVISAPTLLVVDNQEGLLQIGDQVPIALQTSAGATANAVVLTQIEYRDTGIILKVRPRIGAKGEVSLKIEQEVSVVATTQSSGIDSPTISTRKVATHAVLSDGQTLTLGGLVQERDNRTRAKVPGAGDVPLFGALFRKSDSRKARTELIIMLRPTVLHNSQHAKDVTRHWRNKLKGADSILHTGLGSPRHKVQDVLR